MITPSGAPLENLQTRKKNIEKELEQLQLEIDAVEGMDTLTRLACDIHHHFHFQDDDDWWYHLKNGVPDGTGNAFLACKAKARDLLNVLDSYEKLDVRVTYDRALKVVEALSLRKR